MSKASHEKTPAHANTQSSQHDPKKPAGSRKRFITSAVVLVALVVLAIVLAVTSSALTGGTSPSSTLDSATDTSTNTPASEENPSAPPSIGEPNDEGAWVSSAMVAYANGDDLLFVDQDTEISYIPSIPEGGITDANGIALDSHSLAAGNTVRVTGDGVLDSESPAHYANITAIEVLNTGEPADAAQYAESVYSAYPQVNPNNVPSGELSFQTSGSSVALTLEPYAYTWTTTYGSGSANTIIADGSTTAADGTVQSSVPVANLKSPLTATITFDKAPQTAKVLRASVKTNKEGTLVAASPSKVESSDASLSEGGTLTLTLEPGYLYALETHFKQGDVSYAIVCP